MSECIQIFWQKIEQGQLWLQQCCSCQRYIFYPRSFCPHCWQRELNWVKVSGKGKVYSYTVVHTSALPDFKDKTPYIYALIDLQEGIRMAGNLAEDHRHIYPGMPVQAYITHQSGKYLPVFRPLLNQENK
jgi:uncharacterized OB-fold protein